MTLSNIPPSTPTATSPLSTVPVETLRQTFFERVLVHLTSPMDLLPTLERAFPVPATWPETLNQLDDLKRCLDSFRPLNPLQLEKLQAAWDTEYTYESNRIEGNTLTLSETHLVINEGITVGGKTLNEHLEAINHKEAVAYLRELASGETDLSEWMIRSLHELILKNGPHHDERGRYRSVPVSITGTVYVPPPPWQVPKLMEEVILQYQEQKEREHPVALAADMHADLVGIHPFIDGNGRTSRLVMNLLLLRAGFPIANLSGDRSARADYYDTLNASHIHHEAEPFRRLVARHVRESLFRYLAMVSGDMNPDRQDKGRSFFERLATLS